MTADQIRSLQPAFRALLMSFRGCFKRQATFEHCERYVLGLLADVKRKSIEPIALAAGVAVRTLQQFLADFVWDHDGISTMLQQLIVDKHGLDEGIGIIDACAHQKRGDKTPGVQRQWCGETGKVDNCIVGQHLLYTNNDAQNPFSCVVASDLFLPESWHEDRPRCREAGIPDDVVYRPKPQMAIDQVKEAIGHGVRFSWLTFDEDYGKSPQFWFKLDALGQRAVGEVPANFRCWTKPPYCRSFDKEHASRRVDNICRHSPVFTQKKWRQLTVKTATRGPVVWEVKAARVHLVDTSNPDRHVPCPTRRRYWLIVARNQSTDEIKYFVSNALGNTPVQDMMRVAFARWHVEKWFQRAKQEVGFGAFEIRTYTGLLRHWICSRIAMYFLASQTERLRGEKYTYHIGAGCGYCQHLGRENMEPSFSHVGRIDPAMRVLPNPE